MKFNRICIILVCIRLISRICHSSLFFARLLNFRHGLACLCTHTNLPRHRSKWNEDLDIHTMNMFRIFKNL